MLRRRHKNDNILSIPASSRSKGSDYESQGCGLEFHCGQEFFILYFFYVHVIGPCAPRRSTDPILMKSSMTFIRGNRSIERIYLSFERNIAAVLVPSTR